MHRARLAAAQHESRTNLHEAPGVTRCDKFRVRFSNVSQLGSEHRVGSVGLNQIVNARTAAALIGVK